MIASIKVAQSSTAVNKEVPLSLSDPQAKQKMVRENICDYVAELQLHMALQARNLVPSLPQMNDSRGKLLQETQATIEKLVSRQGF
jgi:triphosphoribosyl-dephospho-CoA synthetase